MLFISPQPEVLCQQKEHTETPGQRHPRVPTSLGARLPSGRHGLVASLSPLPSALQEKAGRGPETGGAGALIHNPWGLGRHPAQVKRAAGGSPSQTTQERASALPGGPWMRGGLGSGLCSASARHDQSRSRTASRSKAKPCAPLTCAGQRPCLSLTTPSHVLLRASPWRPGIRSGHWL